MPVVNKKEASPFFYLLQNYLPPEIKVFPGDSPDECFVEIQFPFIQYYVDIIIDLEGLKDASNK